MKTEKSPLVQYEILDIRPMEEALKNPICNSVNIPLSELSKRLHELPDKHSTLLIADCDESVNTAITYLRSIGRNAEAISYFFYGENSQAGYLWKPNPFLKTIIPLLKPGSALDIACGSGRDSVYLASLDWDVTGVDYLEDAIIYAEDLRKKYIPNSTISWKTLDIEKQNLPQGTYDLIIMFFYLNKKIFSDIESFLNPGGSLLVETFTEKHRAIYNKPKKDKYIVFSNELTSLVPTLSIQHYSEEFHSEKHTARLWATKPI